ncbi:hypothetical protein [Desulfoluna spongiiphila]|uniref:hypothetical protein n=1 Tax=Desulfoluna spongiiphila TaxID=419481 RepID=UPI00125ED8FF|nr:hypothetical protein [Desulfoluna spongiiphila]
MGDAATGRLAGDTLIRLIKTGHSNYRMACFFMVRVRRGSPTRGKTLRQPASSVVHFAAGGSQVKDASGGPAGGQTFEKFDKQVKKTDSV